MIAELAVVPVSFQINEKIQKTRLDDSTLRPFVAARNRAFASGRMRESGILNIYGMQQRLENIGWSIFAGEGRRNRLVRLRYLRGKLVYSKYRRRK